MAETTGDDWQQIKAETRHGSGTQGQSSDGTGADGHVSKYSAGTLTDNGNVDAYAADTGAANAYAVTLTPAPTLAAGDEIRLKIANANTGASTLAVNGGTAIAIKKESGGSLVALASGDLNAGQIAVFVYDGTVWQWVSQTGSSGSGGSGTWVQEIPVGTLNGSNTTFTISNTPTANSLALFLNGVEQVPGGVDFTLSGSTITMRIAPKARDTGYFIAQYQH